MRASAGILLFLGFLTAQSSGAEPVDLDDIELPPGFKIEIYANVPNARSLALADHDVVFVSNRRKSSVYAVVPAGEANPQVLEIATGLKTPNGIAFFNGDLYIAEVGRILRLNDVESQLNIRPVPEVLDIELPGETHHGWRYIGIGPDYKLYVAIGAPCNICDRGAEGFAQIIRMNLDGSGREIYAEGIRNSVGFTWHPDTGELWFTDNGRDMMGDDIPPDELNRAPAKGLHFGYPYCHAGDIPDPEFGEGKECDDFTAPAQKLGPHVAALGVKFYTGEMFPPEYHGQIFVAEHGSWNRSKKIGYRISLVRLENGAPVSYEVFAEGWMRKEKVSGRPVDLLVLADGSMLVSDDYGGKIYRISYEK
ncbi:MAG: PQQ-dependent sugar dehydrogenase [Gammaproteobacteria bacterium]|nr:PQQ-dependent sugar dehydrogenase [Gammaproteobacteria bacterium]